jgi:hypothetical protein
MSAESAHGAVLTSVPASTSSVQLVGPNPARKGLIVFAEGSTCFLAYAPTASTVSYTTQVASGTGWTMSEPIYVGPIAGIWTSTTGAAVRITEL